MKKLLLIIFSIFNSIIFSQEINLESIPYTEILHGITIQDNYRFLENLKDTTLQNWYKNNSDYSKSILNSITGRNEIASQVKNFEKRKSTAIAILNYGASGSVFYYKREKTDKKAKLYVKQSPNSEEVLLFDPSDYKSENGQDYSISYARPSWDEKHIAISLAKKGEEIGEIIFLDTQSKQLLPNVITNTWASIGGIQWLKNNSGIIYLHIPVIDRTSKQYILNTELVIYNLHKNTSDKKVIFSKNNNPELKINEADFPYFLNFSNNDQYLIANLGGTSSYRNTYYFNYNELQNEKINYKSLYEKDSGYKSPMVFRDYIYAIGSKGTPNYTIVRTKISEANLENPEIIVKEHENEVIDDYVTTPDGLYYVTTKNGVEAKLYLVNEGKTKQLQLPKQAGKINISIKNNYESDIWVTISGWLNANERYHYNPKTNAFTEANLTPIPKYPEFDDIVVEEIEIPAKDGALVPVSIIRNKNIKKDKQNKVIINAYGAYGIAIKPNFQTLFLTWVLHGGIYVVSHVRGGGEKGNGWYMGGFKETKSNTWNDLIATAEYLIKEKITNPKKMAISGSSAGGITVGRAIIERPDLFKAMFCNACDFNISRLKDTPNGPNNMKEFGNPDDKTEFKNLLEMDAYLSLKKNVNYPASLIDVGMNDARVMPWNSGKFVSKLKEFTSSNNPVLFSVRYDSGHASATDELINKYADYFAFTFWQLGHPKFNLIKK